jgi:hypothetical protein
MNKHIKPIYLISLGAGLLIIAGVVGATQDTTYGVTPIAFVSGLVIIASIIVFLSGLAAMVSDAVKRHREPRATKQL